MKKHLLIFIDEYPLQKQIGILLSIFSTLIAFINSLINLSHGEGFFNLWSIYYYGIVPFLYASIYLKTISSKFVQLAVCIFVGTSTIITGEFYVGMQILTDSYFLAFSYGAFKENPFVKNLLVSVYFISVLVISKKDGYETIYAIIEWYLLSISLVIFFLLILHFHEKRATEEKARADNLEKQLLEERARRAEMENIVLTDLLKIASEDGKILSDKIERMRNDAAKR